MARDAKTTQRLAALLDQLQSLTDAGKLHWERQIGSAHRYARWNNNLIILGPAEPLSDTNIPRYLFVTPFYSPQCIEINSHDIDLGAGVLKLAQAVEEVSRKEPPTDPFAISEDILDRIRF